MEENYKFKLSAFTDKLIDWLDNNPEGNDQRAVDLNWKTELQGLVG